MGAPDLPIFSLYGESAKSADPDFVHIESLATRSAPSNWNIKPHRHQDLNHLILITRGGGIIRYEIETSQFEAPQLLIVPAGVIHGFDWNTDSEGIVLTVSNGQLLQAFQRHQDLRHLFARPNCVVLSEHDCRAIGDLMQAMIRELSRVGLGRCAAIEASLLMLLVHAIRQVQHSMRPSVEPMRQAGMVARYRELVEQRFRLREPIDVYARALGVSLTTLREACATTGQSPTEIRDMRAVLEAQRLLAYTDMPITEVSEAIGIADPAYFSRFFSRKCGEPPHAWRKSINERRRAHG